MAGAVLRMALSPLLAFAAYQAVRLVSEPAALAAGAIVMLALALSPFGRPAGA